MLRGWETTTAVARASPGVRDKVRCGDYGEFGEPNDPDVPVARRRHERSAALAPWALPSVAAGGRFFHSLSASGQFLAQPVGQQRGAPIGRPP